MSQLQVVTVGVLGLGADWQSRYLPALRAMKQRLRVVAVHDDVAIRAAEATRQLDSQAVQGIRELLERTDVRAFLLLGTEWRTAWVVHQLAQRGLPVFVGRGLRLATDEIRSWQGKSEDDGVSVVPEFPLRFQPTMLRLRELVATQLGPIIRLRANVQAGDSDQGPMASLTHMLDCCGSLLKRRLGNVELMSPEPDEVLLHVELIYEAPRNTEGVSDAVSARLTVPPPLTLRYQSLHIQ